MIKLERSFHPGFTIPYISTWGLLFNFLVTICNTQKRCLARYAAVLPCKDNMGWNWIDRKWHVRNISEKKCIHLFLSPEYLLLDTEVYPCQYQGAHLVTSVMSLPRNVNFPNVWDFRCRSYFNGTDGYVCYSMNILRTLFTPLTVTALHTHVLYICGLLAVHFAAQ